MSAAVTPLHTDPPHLHLAAFAMAYPVLSGALDFMEAAGSLALAGIAAGYLDSMNDRQFRDLLGRLEQSMVQASIQIEERAANRIRKAIAPLIEQSRSRADILLMASATNATAGVRAGMGRVMPALPDVVVEEVCRQEVRKALAARNLTGKVANG
ncbi:MAG: hypothetical protein ACRYG8_08965 [Janthinobacterium lividum]